MPFNAVRVQLFSLFINETPPPFFQHTPPLSQPTQPLLPDGLSDSDLLALTIWHEANQRYYAYYNGPMQEYLYNHLSPAAKTKADQFILYEMNRDSWFTTDYLARLSQWAWARADAAISNYHTSPKTASNTLTGSNPPPSPQTIQEP